MFSAYAAMACPKGPALPNAQQTIHSLCPPDIAGAGKEETAAAPSAAAPAPLRKFLLLMDLFFFIFFCHSNYSS